MSNALGEPARARAARGLQGVPDGQSVRPDGEELLRLPEGVSIRALPTHSDERGSLTELLDLRWGYTDKPIPSATAVMIRPGQIKGWALHATMEDRFALFYGDVRIVYYDDRPGSPTRGLVAKVVLSEHDRSIINVPPGVWHAVQNIGQKDALIINFPSEPYSYEDPDKSRLPPDTDRIPFRFDDRPGG